MATIRSAFRAIWPAAAVAFTLLSGGCTTFQSHDPDRVHAISPAPIPDDRWPARNTAKLVAWLTEGRAASGVAVSDDRPRVPPWFESMGRANGRSGPRSSFKGAYGKGVLNVMWSRDGDRDPLKKASVVMRFTSLSMRADKPVDQRLTQYAERQRQVLEQHAAAAGVTLDPAERDFSGLSTEGTAIRLIPPTGERPACGTIIYMAGLGSATYEQSLIEELGRRGWWLLKIATPRVWWYEAKPWYIGSRADVPRIAEQLAAVMDDLVAEPAYAAEAALAYLEEHRPEVPMSPLVMMGCSAGALAALPVVARMPERFDAAVLVGGGANLLEISQKSDLTDGGIHLAWPDDQPRGPWREQLFREYLRFSKLDPYHTAAYLRDKPTLLMQANLDMTVPAHNGWLLWDRLGRPDRYEHVGEHRTLFLTLGGQSNRIADWLAEQMARRPRREPMASGVPAKVGTN